MLDRRRFTALLGATALSGLAAPALIKPSFAQATRRSCRAAIT